VNTSTKTYTEALRDFYENLSPWAKERFDEYVAAGGKL